MDDTLRLTAAPEVPGPRCNVTFDKVAVSMALSKIPTNVASGSTKAPLVTVADQATCGGVS